MGTEGTHLYGDRAPHNLQYVVLVASANLTQERVLIGTANQITVTDNGAGSAVVLSTPQDIHTGATPQFASLGIAAAANAQASLYVEKTWTTPGTNEYGIWNVITYDPSANNTVAPKGYNTTVYTDSAYDFTDQVVAIGGFYRHVGTGTVTRVSGLQFGIQLENNTGGLTAATVVDLATPTWINGNKTIGANRGLWIHNQGHANITTSYGLHIEGQSGSGTLYAIYTSGGDVSFGDTVTLRGSTSDTPGTGFLALYTDNPYWTHRLAATAAADFVLDRYYAAAHSEALRIQRSTGILMLPASLKILERAAAPADTAAYGQYWVKNDAPCIPMFTDDAGADFTVDVTAV